MIPLSDSLEIRTPIVAPCGGCKAFPPYIDLILLYLFFLHIGTVELATILRAE